MHLLSITALPVLPSGYKSNQHAVRERHSGPAAAATHFPSEGGSVRISAETYISEFTSLSSPSSLAPSMIILLTIPLCLLLDCEMISIGLNCLTENWFLQDPHESSVCVFGAKPWEIVTTIRHCTAPDSHKLLSMPTCKQTELHWWAAAADCRFTDSLMTIMIYYIYLYHIFVQTHSLSQWHLSWLALCSC